MAVDVVSRTRESAVAITGVPMEMMPRYQLWFKNNKAASLNPHWLDVWDRWERIRAVQPTSWAILRSDGEIKNCIDGSKS